ncbi:MAG: hypothetical protein ACLSFO_04505 [Anaerovoracaceae bacterium]
MKLSKMHIKTLREVPAEAEIPSHILLLRTGMIRKLASGIYGFMPFGWRSIKKIISVREEWTLPVGRRYTCPLFSPLSSGRSQAAGPPTVLSFGA